MFTATSDTVRFQPHVGNFRQAIGAPGNLAVTPPIATASPASTAAAAAPRAVFGETLRSSDGPVVLRTTVTINIASSVIATHQCATVAIVAFCIFTVTAPSSAAARTAATAPKADRNGPPPPA